MSKNKTNKMGTPHVYPRKLARSVARTVLNKSGYPHVNRLLKDNWRKAAAKMVEVLR